VRSTISLDGDWERRDFLDEAWRWSDALRPTEAAAGEGPPAKPGVSAGWRPARVPGSLIDDAWRAGEIPNPYVDRNSLAAEWIPQRTWLYRRRFTVPPDAPPHAALRFDGIDPGGIVVLDGEEIARHEGMFAPLEIDLDTRLTPGSRHDLVVVVDPAPPMPSQVGRTDRARLLRSRMGYGWDICPRMIHTGIWRSVSLQLFEARLRNVLVDATLSTDHETASVALRAGVEGHGTVVAAILDPEGVTLASAQAPAEDGTVDITMEVPKPRLWWPNGIGEPAMHRLLLRFEDDEALDEQALAIGFRTIEMAPTDGAPADALPYTLVLNGRPTPIRGWNWTPIDALFGVPRPARLRHLVELLRRADVNLLRVWGGGLLESEEFYDACDRAGIMVWQEFAQSSSGVANTPADDPEFFAYVRREAERLVPLRAHHPSLAIWCGGNELAWPDGRPLDDAHPVLAALRDVVARLDPDAAWLPTSPSGPRFDNSLAALAEDPTALHDVHGPWEHQGLAEQHALANATTNLLHSEFGVEGMTNLPSLRATVTEPERWPADRSDPVLAHRGAWWNNGPFVERAFGGDLALEELERASQHLQADGLRTLIEGDRRRWPRNAGTLPWVFNEPFPNAWSNAAVDYFGVPKAAYHAVREAYAPILPGVSFETQALASATELTITPWLVNDSEEIVAGPMRLVLHDATGRCLSSLELDLTAEPVSVVTGSSVTLAVPFDAADLLILDAVHGEHRARRLLSRTDTLEPMRRLPQAALQATVTADGDRWSVVLVNRGATTALEARLGDARPVGWPERTGAAYLDANLVTLLPGEHRTIRIDWRQVPEADRQLRLSGWNIDARMLAP
jgi:beta-mannosidase